MPDELRYSKPLQLWQKRRLQKWIVRAAVVAIAFGLLWLVLFARWQIRVLYWQRQCMAYTPPPNQLVFEDMLPARVAPPVGFSTGLFSTAGESVAANPIECRARFDAAVSNMDYVPYSGTKLPQFYSDGGTLLLHAMKNGAGATRIVQVRLLGRGPSRLDLDCGVGRPGTFSFEGFYESHRQSPPFPFPESDLSGKKLRVFAGHVDPARPDHFTVDWEIGGKRGVLDGVLRDDDEIIFQLTAASGQ